MASNPERHGDWTLTYTGKRFWALDARREDVCIEDIAHHLALTCRFNGACREFYSVAQHSMIVALQLPPRLKFAGLMHDATEAYLGDMVRPVKRALPSYQIAEQRLERVIRAAFNLPVLSVAEQALVKDADNIALMTERRDLLIESPHRWEVPPVTLPGKIYPWSPELAEQNFLAAYEELKP